MRKLRYPGVKRRFRRRSSRVRRAWDCSTIPSAAVRPRLRRNFWPRGRICGLATVYLGGVLSYLLKELLEATINKMKRGSRRLTPRAVALAVQSDPELGSLLKEVIISRGGVTPDCIEKANNKKGPKKRELKSQGKVSKCSSLSTAKKSSGEDAERR